jgi:hypothetical protein
MTTSFQLEDRAERETVVPNTVWREVVDGPEVDRVPTPGTIRAEAVLLGEEVTKTGADAWHAGGYRGAGTKVAIVDGFSTVVWNAAHAAGEVPDPAGVVCRRQGTSCDIWTVSPDSTHGTAVAEVVHEMAPDAALYLGRAYSTDDYMAVLDSFAAQGVGIVLNQLWGPYEGPGDGTGDASDIVDHAISHGMVFITPAGNLAGGGYWRGTWVDANANGFLEFAPGDELLEFICGFGYGLRWSDWATASPTDYDVLIFEDPDALIAGTIKASSTDSQVAGSPPLEDYNPSLGAAGCDGPTDVDLLAIGLFGAGGGTAGDVLELP